MSLYICLDPASIFSHFCDQTLDDDASLASWERWANVTIGSATRAHVCDNCDVEISFFYYTIGETSTPEMSVGCCLEHRVFQMIEGSEGTTSTYAR